MNNPYDLHSWSKLYREEALSDTQRRHHSRRVIGKSTPIHFVLVMLALVVILLGASASPSAAATDASSYAGMRYTFGMSPSTSIECYTFYSDGTVELRHGGTSTVSDIGTYQGYGTYGQIFWASGRLASTVVTEAEGLTINDLKVSPVENCY
jgi:hypothetical protein